MSSASAEKDNISALNKRNEHAVQFLTSLTSSNIPTSTFPVIPSIAAGFGQHRDCQLPLGQDKNIMNDGSGDPYNSMLPLHLQSGYSVSNDKTTTELPHGVDDYYVDGIPVHRHHPHHHPQSEFVLMKPSSFPMVLASIKPFPGKDVEKSRYGAGKGQMTTASAMRKKDHSFAYLLYPLNTLSMNVEQEVRNAAAASGGANNYQPNKLDDPGLHKGLQRTVLGLTGCMSTIFEYTRPDDLRQEVNDHFRETHPELYAAGLTLDQIRRLRAHMLRVTQEQNLELSSAAIGWVYFEKLIWKGYVAKDNRKLVAAACLFLALKINESREVSVSRSLQAIQRRFEVSAKSVLDHEFLVFAELEFSLWVPCQEFMPHFLRMFEAIDLYRTLSDYLGDSDFFACKPWTD